MYRKVFTALLAAGTAFMTGLLSAAPALPNPVPAQGQTPEQMATDKSACYAEARAATGFNPNSSPAVAAPVESAPTEGRGESTVRKAAGGAAMGAAVGAIAGDAGKGAAIGATARW